MPFFLPISVGVDGLGGTAATGQPHRAVSQRVGLAALGPPDIQHFWGGTARPAARTRRRVH